jgi:hypothetical protein
MPLVDPRFSDEHRRVENSAQLVDILDPLLRARHSTVAFASPGNAIEFEAPERLDHTTALSKCAICIRSPQSPWGLLMHTLTRIRAAPTQSCWRPLGRFRAAYGVCAGRCGGRRKSLRPLRPLPFDQAG